LGWRCIQVLAVMMNGTKSPVIQRSVFALVDRVELLSISSRFSSYLQLGLVPVHVYLDIPWVPYSDLYKTIGFSTDVRGLPDLMRKINDMDLQDLERMEEKIRALQVNPFHKWRFAGSNFDVHEEWGKWFAMPNSASNDEWIDWTREINRWIGQKKEGKHIYLAHWIGKWWS